MKKSIRYSFYLFISVVLLLEITLRIYNPFHFRVKGDHVVLETNKKYVIDNSKIPVLDKSIVHTKNELGFRGPSKPKDFNNRLTIVTIGGSTTECQFLDDKKTWTELLFHKLQHDFPDVWMNTAGVAGHSSYGHIQLIKEHIIPLKPDYLVILLGANDIRRSKLDSKESLFIWMARKSALCNVLLNIGRTREAKTKNLTDTYIDLKTSDSLTLSDQAITQYLRNEEEWVNQYRNRVRTIIDLCISNQIKPVLVTQPCLVGDGTDPVTHISLANVKLKQSENGKLWWSMLEKYNDGTRQVAKEKNVPLIDLAHLLPKSSENFYDLVHFTNHGAAQTAQIIYDSLRLRLRGN